LLCSLRGVRAPGAPRGVVGHILLLTRQVERQCFVGSRRWTRYSW
jgi:hypothetical protein